MGVALVDVASKRDRNMSVTKQSWYVSDTPFFV